MTNESERVHVNMSEMKIATTGSVLESSGIGSCVVITLYDPLKKLGALAHPMIALPTTIKNTGKNLRFVEDTIDVMVDTLEKAGAEKSRLKCKLFGGAHMFEVFDSSLKAVGITNVDAAKKKLEKLGIAIVANDTGGNVGRSISFDLQTGIVEVRIKI